MRVDAHAAGVSQSEFWNMTPWEIGLAIKGFHQRVGYDRLLATENAAYNALATGNKGCKVFARNIVDGAQKAIQKG